MSNLIILGTITKKPLSSIEEEPQDLLTKTPTRINIASNDTSRNADAGGASAFSSPRSPLISSPTRSISPSDAITPRNTKNRFLNKIRSLHSSPEKRNISTLSHSDKMSRKEMNDFEFQSILPKAPSSPNSYQRFSGKKSISSQDIHDFGIHAETTPPLSPTASTASRSSISPRDEKMKYRYHCHCCQGPLEVKQLLQISDGSSSASEDEEEQIENGASTDIYEYYFLSIRCQCVPTRFFCSRICHRTHHLGLTSEGRKICQEKKFNEVTSEIKIKGKTFSLNPLEIPLVWTEVQYVHPLSDYEEISPRN